MKLKFRHARNHPDANFKLPYDLTSELRRRFHPNPSRKTEYLMEQMWSKFVSSDTAPAKVRRQRAINKWLATEEANRSTNDRLLSVLPDYNILSRVTYERFMRKVNELTLGLLGSTVPSNLLTDVTKGSFSSGATTSRRRAFSHPTNKYTGEADVTERCLHWAQTALSESPVWASLRDSDKFRIVEGNVLFTVPKNTEIDRCACKEPDLNMYFQKGVGDFIRNRLRTVGIDLNDQSRNRALARQGSVSGDLATIDLSSASDSISYEVVAQSIPILWLTYLDDLRSPITIIDGDRHVNQMYSSMGNGFTFELESLLFWAFAKATAYFTGTSGVISVYGDDIIVPSQMCQDLMTVLSFLGFSVNPDKSFWDGDFRESCGGHYSNGQDITPFYIRKPITHLMDVITLANQIRKWSGVNHDCDFLDLDVADCWHWLASFVPKCFWGGYDLNDSSRLVSYEQPDKPKRLIPINLSKPSGIGGYLFWLDSASRRKQVEHENHNFSGTPFLEGLETSMITSSSGKYRSRRVGWRHGVTGRVFLSELIE